MPTTDLNAPFPYFGGKRRAADLIWERFGSVRCYLEPFFGSGAVLLRRPLPFDGPETVNDLDGLIANAWRAIRAAPEEVARYADWPVLESCLHARHAWLVGQKDSLQARLEGDPEFFDPKIAGWWIWGTSCWIGSGFCSGKGPWRVVDGELVRTEGGGQGVNRKRPHLGDDGRGVNRKLPQLRDDGGGVTREADICAYFQTLAQRLRLVRVCCGDWSRILGPSVTGERLSQWQPIGVFLDPPYADTAGRDVDLYRLDSLTVAHEVRDWAVAHGDDPRYRICLAGYDGEHEMPATWTVEQGRAGQGAGYAGQKHEGDTMENARKERLWFSPHCLAEPQGRLL
jgi:hypothetical protein